MINVYNEDYIDNTERSILTSIVESNNLADKLLKNNKNKFDFSEILNNIMRLIDKIIELGRYYIEVFSNNNKKLKNIMRLYHNTIIDRFNKNPISIVGYEFKDLKDSRIKDIFPTMERNLDNSVNKIKKDLSNLKNDNVSNIIDDSINVVSYLTEIPDINTIGDLAKYIKEELKNGNKKVSIDSRTNFRLTDLSKIIEYFEKDNSTVELRKQYEACNKICNNIKHSMNYKKLNTMITSNLSSKESLKDSVIRYYLNMIREQANIVWTVYKTIIDIEREKRTMYIRILNQLVPEGFNIKNNIGAKNESIYEDINSGSYFNEIDYV